ncbi:MAG: CARDB domain-containing protein, partial [Planctomycetota bacterium]
MATELSMIEDPAGSGLKIGRGYGSLDASGDVDFWSFEAEAGDLLTILSETPNSDVNTRTTLYDVNGNYITEDSFDGPNDDDIISRFEITADGTYFVRMNRRGGASIGDYITHVMLTTGLTHESDSEYANDSLATASPTSFSANGSQRDAVLVGQIMAGQSGNVDEDIYDLGDVASGETILISSRLPDSSLLKPLVEIRDENNLVVSINSNPSDAVARADVLTGGRYYAVILASEGSGGRGNYLMDVSIQPTSELNFADLAVASLSGPTNVQSGETVTFNWTIGNFGAAATPVDTWTDRLVLSTNDRYGDDDDIPLALVTHTGSLAISETYDASTSVQIPVGISGTFNLLLRTDATAVVPEFIFEDNNVGISDAPIEVAPLPLADLQTTDVAISTNETLAGAPVQITWNVTNEGDGTTNNGTPTGVVNVWTDRIVLSLDQIFGNADDVFIEDVVHDGALESGESYSGSWIGALPSSLSNTYYVLVQTDYGPGFGQVLEAATAGDDGEANNTGMGGPVAVANQPFPDFIANWEVTPSSGELGRTIDVAWTVTNNASNGNGAAADTTWYDRIILSQDAIVGNGDDVTLRDERQTGPLSLGNSYTDAATVTLPNNFSGDGYLFVVSDARSQVYEFVFEGNNASLGNPINVTAADLQVEATLSTFNSVFGETIPIDFTVTNTGDAPVTALTRNRIYLSSDATLSAGDDLLATIDAPQTTLGVGESYSQNDLLVQLPLRANLSVGDYHIIVVTDALSAQPESDESNNVAVTTESITLDFPALPDLQVENVVVDPADATAGGDVTVTWQTANNGNVDVENSFRENIVVVNLSNGKTLLSTTLDVELPAGQPITAGGSANRSYTFTLPNGLDGAGNLAVTVSTDSDNVIVESFGGNVPEGNNSTTANFTSQLPPYPDLVVENLSFDPTAVQTGETVETTWTIRNDGTSTSVGSFNQTVRVVRRDTNQVLLQVDVPYDASLDGDINAAETRPQSIDLLIPDGSDSAGELDITVTVDSNNDIFEFNGTQTAETNNATLGSIVASLAPYPDLAVSQVVAPTQTIADPANITISYRVDNVGELTAQSDSWVDAVVVSTDEIFGDGDDRVVATFPRTDALAVAGSYDATETFQLPPSFTGRYFLYVSADHDESVFENDREANNAARSAEVFDVMPIPYADLVVTSVTPPAEGSSGQPVSLSWRVENQGIGLTNRANWTDRVYLTTDPTGNTGRQFLGSFPHLGQLAVGNGYDRTVSVTLPQGISGTRYLQVVTGGVFEFVQTDNNSAVSSEFDVSLSPSPDLVVTNIDAPSLDVLEGTLIDIEWTVRNDGGGDAEGSWRDRLTLRKVGDPSAPVISLGTYRYEGSVGAGQ